MTVENWVRRKKAAEVAGSLEAFPDRDLAALTRQLRDLEWVVPLEMGLSLTQDLRTELGPLVAAPPPMETGA